MYIQTPYNSFENTYDAFSQEFPIPLTAEATIHGERITDILSIEGYEDEPWLGSGGETVSGKKSGFGLTDLLDVVNTGANVIQSLKRQNVTYNQLTGQTSPAGSIDAPAVSASRVSGMLVAGIGAAVVLVVVLLIIKIKK